MTALLSRSFLGSGLTVGGAAASLAVGLAFWPICALAFAAMPS